MTKQRVVAAGLLQVFSLDYFWHRMARGISGRWPTIAILAPLLLLAALGLRGLQASRQYALEEARRQVMRGLDQALPSLLSRWNEIRREIPELRLYPSPPIPAPPDEAQTLYANALELSGKSPTQAAADLARLETHYPNAFAASGLPLLPLAEWARLRLETDSNALPARAEAFAAAALRTHPSVLTPDLMMAGEALLQARGVDSPAFASWRQQWKEDEWARSVWRLHEKEIASVGPSLWLMDKEGRAWWVLREGNPMRKFIARDALRSHMRSMADRLQPLLPDYTSVDFSLNGVPLLESRGEILAARDIAGLSANIILAFPSRLYAQQRQQTFWLAALLASALAAALAGFWAMRHALARERQLGQLKSDFVSSVSHELRAPVASMRLMAENLESGAVVAEARRNEYHHLIAEECRRLSALIDNVLDFARIEQDRKTYDFAETDMAALVRDALQFMQPRAAQRRQEILPEELQDVDPPPICDGLAVRQALINLLDNAIKFSPEETTIRVHLRARGPGSGWEISVRDEGPGIPAAEHEAIFERFHRLGSELRRETQGAGIGLSIVRHIAQAHGGVVELESRLGAGSRFTLVLPMQPPDMPPQS